MTVSLSSRGLACAAFSVVFHCLQWKCYSRRLFTLKCVLDLCVGGVVLNPSFMAALRLGDLHVCGHQLKRGNVVERFLGSQR